MTDLTTIFCETDDFCKEFKKQFGIKQLSNGKGKRNRSMKLTMSEVMTISIWYHFSGYATFKDYYTKHVEIYLKKSFPDLVSYTRFIELKRLLIMPMFVFLITRKMGSCTGISIIDSFKLEACHILRQSSHKTLKAIASKGKTSTGWFFGVKVHLIINHNGEIVSFYITPGNVADNNKKVLFALTKKVLGKLFGDKGYLVNQAVFEKLYQKGVKLVTKIRKNMKNKLMDIEDKILLRKRGVIESVNDILKEHLQMKHTRHRSLWGFILHIFTSITAYQMREKKPKICFRYNQKLIAA